MAFMSEGSAESARLPEYVGSWLGDRDRTITRHGFTEKELPLDWWGTELSNAGLGQYSISLHATDSSEPSLTRGDLFQLASHLDGCPTDDEPYLNLLWHTLVWGSGKSVRNNRRRIYAFADAVQRSERVELLRGAVEHARAGDPADAYATLIRRGGGKIPGLGPAFFTKFLYFASAQATDRPCLILDARVATTLHKAGWTSLPLGSYNWHTDRYADYCNLLTTWAIELSPTNLVPVSPDEIERALFEGKPF